MSIVQIDDYARQLYAAHGYRVTDRSPAALPGGLSLATVRMSRNLPNR